jgi:transcriptional regulator with XRE-family HTH domain
VTPAQAKKWRKETKRTQEAIARLLGITRGAYALWEQGRSVIGKPRLVALAALSGQKETATLRQGVAGVRLAVAAWSTEVERTIHTMTASLRCPLANSETHRAALKISSAYIERTKKSLSMDEFVALHARLVRALL